MDARVDQIQDAMLCWGINATLYHIDAPWCPAGCLVRAHRKDVGPVCIYLRSSDTNNPIMARQQPASDDIVHMQRLCTSGFTKAVVLTAVTCDPVTQIVLFDDLSDAGFCDNPDKRRPTMPLKLPVRVCSAIDRFLCTRPGTTNHLVRLPLDPGELGSIIDSAAGILRQEVSHLPLSEAQIQEIGSYCSKDAGTDMYSFDRLLSMNAGARTPGPLQCLVRYMIRRIAKAPLPSLARQFVMKLTHLAILGSSTLVLMWR